MLIGIAVWLFVGACFGWFRARARYHREYAALRILERRSAQKDPAFCKRRALIAAAIEFVKWTLLGIFSGVSFVAWIVLALAVNFENEAKKSGILGATVFSVVIFILGAIALDKQSAELKKLEALPDDPNQPRDKAERKKWEEEDRRYEEAKTKLLASNSSPKRNRR